MKQKSAISGLRHHAPGGLKRGLWVAGASLLTLALLAGCAETKLVANTAKMATQPEPPKTQPYKIGKPYQVDGAWYYPKADYDYDETGIASWYGPGFHGGNTANGEIYDENALTAAHKTLPMPSLVRVTNLENGRSIVVRINDRGPFVNNRVIDMTRRGAQLLGFDLNGTAKVRVQVMKEESMILAAQASTKGGDGISPAPKAAPAGTVASKALPPAGQGTTSGTTPGATAGTTSASAPAPASVPKPAPAPSPAASAVQSAATKPAASGTSGTSATAAPAATVNAAPLPKPTTTPAPAATQTAAAPAAKPATAVPAPVKTPAASVSAPAKPAVSPVKSPVETPVVSTDDTPREIVDMSSPIGASELPAPDGEVTVQPVKGNSSIYIQAGAFLRQNNAQQLSSKLSALATAKVTQVKLGQQTFYRVRLGPIASVEKADELLQQVIDDGNPEARIIVE